MEGTNDRTPDTTKDHGCCHCLRGNSACLHRHRAYNTSNVERTLTTAHLDTCGAAAPRRFIDENGGSPAVRLTKAAATHGMYGDVYKSGRTTKR
jgi:hypothetical protein